MLSPNLERLVELVSNDDSLMAEIADIHDRGEFCAAAGAVASAHGIAITEDELTDGLREARTAWLARWV